MIKDKRSRKSRKTGQLLAINGQENDLLNAPIGDAEHNFVTGNAAGYYDLTSFGPTSIRPTPGSVVPTTPLQTTPGVTSLGPGSSRPTPGSVVPTTPLQTTPGVTSLGPGSSRPTPGSVVPTIPLQTTPGVTSLGPTTSAVTQSAASSTTTPTPSTTSPTPNNGLIVNTATAPIGQSTSGPYGGAGGGGGSGSDKSNSVPLTMWQKIWGFTKSHWLLLAVVVAGTGYVIYANKEE
jgi:hypothetical protein